MEKLRKIEPNGFRGVRLPVPLDFGADCASAVIFGANGHGKSSFVDALEWYLTGAIDHLQREHVGRAAYRHRAHDADELASVRVEFSDPELNGALEIDVSRQVTLSADSDRTEPFREAAGGELVILRYKDLSQFVDKTKGEKLEALGPLIGLEVLSEVRNHLVRAVRQLEEDLDHKVRAIRDRRETIATTLAQDTITIERTWELITELLATTGVEASVRNVDGLAEALQEVFVSSDPARDQKLKQLRDARDAIEALTELPDELPSAETFASAFNSLTSDPTALRELQLVDVWKAGKRVVGTDWWESGTCPLCGQATDDENLESRIEQHLASATDTSRRCHELEQIRADERGELDPVRSSARKVLSLIENVPECEPLRSVADELVQASERLRSVLSKPLKQGEEVTDDELAELPRVKAEFHGASQAVLDALSTRLNALSPSAQERARLDAYRRLSAVESDLRQLNALDIERGVIEQQTESMHAVVRAFEQHERQTTTAVLDRISANVSDYYKRLHGGERYDNIRLEFLPDGRGLEFSLEAHGEIISPPRLLLSESHMNSLGLCLFLAAAREFNTATRFLVLDDIVNSFDADHRA